MKPREVIDVQLELFFGSEFPQKIQRLVNEELNQGRWTEDYDLAVCQGVIDRDAARKLLEIVLTEHAELRIDEADLRKIVEDRLPQSLGGSVSWIVVQSEQRQLREPSCALSPAVIRHLDIPFAEDARSPAASHC